MKKVFHFIDSGGLYGAERVILNLSREMVKEQHVEPIVGCIVRDSHERVDLYDAAKRIGIKAEKIIFKNEYFPFHVITTAIYFKKMGVNLIHSHGYKPSVVGFLIGLITGIKFMATCHLWYLDGVAVVKQRMMTWMELFFYRFCRHIVGVSEPIKQFLIQSGVSEKRISVIKNGIPVSDYSIGFDEATFFNYKKRLGISPEAFVLINTARLSKQKAQKNLVLAAQELRKRNVRVLFLIIGEGELRPELEKLVEDSDLQGEVRLMGFIDDITKCLNVADAFVLPSYDEGLPISLLEAMASRTPALVTPVGDIPKIVRHMHSAYIVPVNDITAIADGIEWMVGHRDLCRKMADCAFAEINKNYSSVAMYRAYERIYTELISQN